jgi:transketolase
MAEGSIWEAFEHAAHYGLDNLTAIVDVNRLGQTTETMLGWDLDTYAARARAFGWHAITLDGHDLDAVEAAYAEAEATRGRPTVLFAKTLKGKGVKAVEDKPGKHGKPLDDPEDAIAELGGARELTVAVRKPDPAAAAAPGPVPGKTRMPTWEVGEEVATRRAYGEALTALGDLRPDVVALDGEVSNSTNSELFAKAHPDRYFEMYIAEQQTPTAWTSPENSALNLEIRQVITAVLDELPARQRAVLSLRDVTDRTADEVCEMLQISAANQRVLLHRARAVVRERLADYLMEEKEAKT